MGGLLVQGPAGMSEAALKSSDINRCCTHSPGADLIKLLSRLLIQPIAMTVSHVYRARTVTGMKPGQVAHNIDNQVACTSLRSDASCQALHSWQGAPSLHIYKGWHIDLSRDRE